VKTEKKYRIGLSLSILNELGIKLYSNVPPVLSEVVANAWDADADEVTISLAKDYIVIEDNGEGMSHEDINKKYLTVGYKRRKDKNRAVTKKYRRNVMGRKGIGKLSLFAIADTIEIHSYKGGEANGCILSGPDIRKLIEKNDSLVTYEPKAISEDKLVRKSEGTKIVLKNLKRRITHSESGLRKRIARRFSIIGEEYNFTVKINDIPIRIQDRDYFHKIKNLWVYGEDKYSRYCKSKKLKSMKVRDGQIGKSEHTVHGWIGAAVYPQDLIDEQDNLNKVVIMARGKLVQEDILEDFVEGLIYTKYLIGEIHADFFDLDDFEDISTSSRQEVIKYDPRYIELQNWIQKEFKYISNEWLRMRKDEGAEQALEIPAIFDWFNLLKGDDKKSAKSLFGKIGQLAVHPEEKRHLYKHGVLAFESFRHKKCLKALENLTADNIQAFSEIFSNFDDIEASLYHQIIKERLQIIDTLRKKVDDNELERVVQEHLYNHLWLLDPSWIPIAETPLFEQQITTAFKGLDAKLTPEEKSARFDIKYRKTYGMHIIIELKRAGVTTHSLDLAKQANKYRIALKKLLEASGKGNEPVEVVCVVGKQPSDWSSEDEHQRSLRSLESYNTRVVRYFELIEDAYRAYQEFLDQNEKAGRISKLIEDIEMQDFVTLDSLRAKSAK